MTTLSSRKISLPEASLLATTVVQGKANYYLQLAPFTVGELDKLDKSLDKMLRRRAGWPRGTSLEWLHSPRSRGGLGIFTFQDLLTSAQTTELLVRLASPGLVGQVAKARWDAAQPSLWENRPAPAQPPAGHSLTLYTLWMAARRGYTVVTPDDHGDIAHRQADSTPIHEVIPHKFLSRLEAMHIQFLDQVCTDGAFRPWSSISRNLSPEPKWYRDLQVELPTLPTTIRPPPDRPVLFSLDWTPVPLQPVDDFLDYDSDAATPATPPSEWDSSPPPSPPLAEGHSVFFTDGSVDPLTQRGAYAVIGPPPSDMPPAAPQGNHAKWRTTALRHITFLSAAFARLGAEPISIDTMELMAILALARNAPANDVLVYTDSSYVVKGCRRHGLSARRQIRRSNRYLWHELGVALAKHRANGFQFVVAKCSAHGKDPGQDPAVTLGNDQADAESKAANKSGHARHTLLKDPFTHRLLFRGQTVRGDPRRHMKKHFQHCHFESAVLLPKAGVIPSQIRPPTHYSAQSIITPMSGHKAYSKGLIKHSAFMYAARANALYTPSKCYRNTFVKGSPVPVDKVSMRIRALSPIEPGDPPRFPPKEAFTPIDAHGAPLCPLCSGISPDTHHYVAHVCPHTLAMSGLLRRTVASLLSSFQAFHGVTSLTTIVGLFSWLQTVVPEIRCTDILAPLRDGSSQLIDGHLLRAWPAHGLGLPSTGTHFGVVPSSLVLRGPKCPFRFHSLLTIPSGRTILVDAVGKKKDEYKLPVFSDQELSLVIFGDSTPPPITTVEVTLLGDFLRCSVLWGPHKLVLTWAGTSWPLDTLIEDPQPILDSCLLLPLDAAPPARPESAPADALLPPAEDTVAVPTGSYYGLIPRRFVGPLRPNLELLPKKLKLEFLSELIHSLTAGQHQIWCAVKCAISQVLQFRRRRAIALAYQRPAPRKRPYFVALRTHKARYPPAQRFLNLAADWINTSKPADRNPLDSDELSWKFERFCVRHNVTRPDRPTLSLAILTLLNDEHPAICSVPLPQAEALPPHALHPPLVGFSTGPPTPPPLPHGLADQPFQLFQRGTRYLREPLRRLPREEGCEVPDSVDVLLSSPRPRSLSAHRCSFEPPADGRRPVSRAAH